MTDFCLRANHFEIAEHTSVVDNTVSSSKLRTASVMMASYGRKRLLITCGARRGAKRSQTTLLQKARRVHPPGWLNLPHDPSSDWGKRSTMCVHAIFNLQYFPLYISSWSKSNRADTSRDITNRIFRLVLQAACREHRWWRADTGSRYWSRFIFLFRIDQRIEVTQPDTRRVPRFWSELILPRPPHIFSSAKLLGTPTHYIDIQCNVANKIYTASL